MAGFVFKKEQLADKNIGTPEVLPLGTGPYKLVEFVPTDHVTLEARDDYWGPKPVVKRITFQAIPDRRARLLGMQNGNSGHWRLATLIRKSSLCPICDIL